MNSIRRRYTVRGYAVPTQQRQDLASNCCGVDVCKAVFPMKCVFYRNTIGNTTVSLTPGPTVQERGIKAHG